MKKENYCLVPFSVPLFFAHRAAAWNKRCNFCHFQVIHKTDQIMSTQYEQTYISHL